MMSLFVVIAKLTSSLPGLRSDIFFRFILI
jgi:hypothetical protein